MIRSDARALPFPDASFDLIFTSPPWDNLGVLTEARPEMRRVLKRKGRMAIVMPHLDDPKLATLVLANRDWTERQSFAIPKPSRRVGPRYFSLDPDLVANVLRRHSGKSVLDPFCGVGTVPDVATELGWHGVGCDLHAA